MYAYYAFLKARERMICDFCFPLYAYYVWPSSRAVSPPPFHILPPLSLCVCVCATHKGMFFIPRTPLFIPLLQVRVLQVERDRGRRYEQDIKGVHVRRRKQKGRKDRRCVRSNSLHAFFIKRRHMYTLPCIMYTCITGAGFPHIHVHYITFKILSKPGSMLLL